ncbi:MAG: ABC transporter [Chloroflexi bacterium HGW-Chloroflexi-10]|nr:MAG: ABC transporter [Chloroflexi bacterium HGW-Chloroflexi-10]
MTVKKFPENNLLDHAYQGEPPFKTLLYFFRQEKLSLAGASLIFIVKHSPVWLLPLLTANIIDVVVQHGNLANLWLNALALVTLLFLNIPLHILYMRVFSSSMRAVETHVRSALCRQLQQLSLGYYTRVSAGVLQTKVVRDVETLEQMVRQLFDGGLAAISNLAGAIVITAIRAPAFLPFFLVMVPISSTLILTLRRSLSKRNQEFRAEIERMAARVNEMTHLIPITRAHGLEKFELNRMDDTLNHVQHAGVELDTVNAVFGAISWVAFNIFNILCLVAAAWASYTGFIPLSAGEVVMLSGFFSSLTNAVMLLVNLIPPITKGFESIRSMGEVLESPDLEHNEGKLVLEQVQGMVSFEQVHFAYTDTQTAAVKDFSLTVAAGETIALVGHSGAGKSTILNLVIGFVRPSNGRILLDGRDMQDLDLRTFRRFLAVVPQDSILFDGSVRDNLTYGIPKVPDAMVETALRNANAWSFVQDMPDGLDTIIGERGTRLSGGQKQRLAIARALIRNPRVLILDEATSALDSEAEALIQEALTHLMKGRTTLVVAHRLSTIQKANRIVVMQQGSIVEIGTHQELLEKNGVYARLHARQQGMNVT